MPVRIDSARNYVALDLEKAENAASSAANAAKDAAKDVADAAKEQDSFYHIGKPFARRT